MEESIKILYESLHWLKAQIVDNETQRARLQQSQEQLGAEIEVAMGKITKLEESIKILEKANAKRKD